MKQPMHEQSLTDPNALWGGRSVRRQLQPKPAVSSAPRLSPGLGFDSLPAAYRLKLRLAAVRGRSHLPEESADVPPMRLDWVGAAATCVGAAHLRREPPIPCQDATLVMPGPMPLLVVADGAGSAPVSDLGAEAVVQGLKRLAQSLHGHFARALNGPRQPDAPSARALAHTLVQHACGLLEDLAVGHRRASADFRTTLLVALGGQMTWLWAKVGDGALVIERDGRLTLLGEAGKGEFANQTVFLGPGLRPEQVQWGLEATAGLTGIAAMTDGAAERLVSTDGARISGQIATFLAAARERRLRRADLHQFLQAPEVWRTTTGDDRGLAILAPASCPDATAPP